MAIFVLTDAKVTVNTVNLSDHDVSVTLDLKADTQDLTAFGATWKTNKPGLKSGSGTLEYNQDFATSSVDATLWAALGASVAFTAKGTSGANSTTNPEYQFNAVITDYQVFGQKVGEAARARVNFTIDGAVTRATS